MNYKDLDLLLTLLALAGLVYVFARLAITVIPLQIKEALVVNGLRKLRRQMLISGVSIMAVAFIGTIILFSALTFPHNVILMDVLVCLLVLALIINAETKHSIYHQQYTDEHKELSRQIHAKMTKQGG